MKILVALLAAIVIFGSCEKCAECHYDQADNEVEIGEYCKDDLEAIENSGFYDVTTDSTYEVHCHEH